MTKPNLAPQGHLVPTPLLNGNAKLKRLAALARIRALHAHLLEGTTASAEKAASEAAVILVDSKLLATWRRECRAR